MLIKNSSSFRDNKAIIYNSTDKIFRKVDKSLNIDFSEFLNSDFYKNNLPNIIKTKILNARELDNNSIPNEKNHVWLEHEKLEYLIYPYELTFNQLKDSAILFLDLYLDALEESYDIIDASAYNIQFKNNNPIFIDMGSFAKLKNNSEILWHKQFCENYLAPLLIKSKADINFNDIFKGNLDGIDLKLASKILPLSTFFDFNIIANIHLHSLLNSKISSSTHIKKNNLKVQKISKNKKKLIAIGLKKTINKLKSKNKSYWSTYSKINSYSEQETIKKEKYVAEFVKSQNISCLLDVGCNDGHYSKICFNNNVKKVVGIDNDLDALDRAYLRFKNKKLNFYSIYQNFSNPSSGIGWNSRERLSFTERFKDKFDGVICLALMHHICIGKNVPVEMFIEYLGNFSKNFLLEFVSEDDDMVKNLLRNKENLTKYYNVDYLKKTISRDYRIVSETKITDNRTLIHFKK
ncbi:class I SAM-dependent methyltransferase [Candidatus Pelagibacter bacterium nBUS_30]|uniref:class I SAM-dependent methyltransferase n=1 Tax=Candidatus Pelagibacter bacterium nBUS_30 TaxID=3374191 RepID=UPI003EB90317